MTDGACLICECALTAAKDSEEHVIPNAIGGRWKMRGILCRSCNNTSGVTWDAALAAQLQALCLMFAISRERRQTPPMKVKTTAGEQLLIQSDGRLASARPACEVEETAEGLTINISGRSRREIRKALLGTKRKYPLLDIERLLAETKSSSSYPTGAIRHSFVFGGDQAGRSIVKTALALAHSAGIPGSHCQVALDYIRNVEASPCFGYFYERDPLRQRPPKTPLHCVSIAANPDSGLVVGYVEYFGVYRVVCHLGDGYVGERIDKTYALDPRTGQKLDLCAALNFSADELHNICHDGGLPDGAIDAFNVMLPVALERQFDAERQRVVADAVRHGFANCGAQEGDILTEQHLEKLSGLVMERMQPFLIRHIAPDRYISLAYGVYSYLSQRRSEKPKSWIMKWRARRRITSAAFP